MNLEAISAQLMAARAQLDAALATIQAERVMLEAEQVVCAHERTKDISVMGSEIKVMKCLDCGLVIEEEWEEV